MRFCQPCDKLLLLGLEVWWGKRLLQGTWSPGLGFSDSAWFSLKKTCRRTNKGRRFESLLISRLTSCLQAIPNVMINLVYILGRIICFFRGSFFGSCFYAFLLLCFCAFQFFAFPGSLLVYFSAFLLLCFCASVPWLFFFFLFSGSILSCLHALNETLKTLGETLKKSWSLKKPSMKP